MFARQAVIGRLLLRIGALVAASTALPASAQQIFYEDFEDETLAENAAINNATIGGGILSLNDVATGRATFSVVQPFDYPVMTFSFDMAEPIVEMPPRMEVIIRAGAGTAQNTLSSTEMIAEAILFRAGANRGAYVNNGNETIFLIANNQDATLLFPSPVDGVDVTLSVFQQVGYVLNHDTSTYGVLRGVAGFTAPLGRAFERFGIGSSTNNDVGTFAIDNVLVMEGATFERDLVQKVPGDVDDDLDVDMDDFTAIQTHFQQSVTMRSEGDLNGDGMVDWVDFRQWKSHHPTAPPSPEGGSQGVPEPASAFLALATAAGLARMRRH